MKLFSLYIDQETAERLAALRDTLQISAAEIIRRAVKQYYERFFGNH